MEIAAPPRALPRDKTRPRAFLLHLPIALERNPQPVESTAGSIRFDPTLKCLQIVAQEFLCQWNKLAIFSENIFSVADVRFGLLQGRHVQKHE